MAISTITHTLKWNREWDYKRITCGKCYIPYTWNETFSVLNIKMVGSLTSNSYWWMWRNLTDIGGIASRYYLLVTVVLWLYMWLLLDIFCSRAWNFILVFQHKCHPQTTYMNSQFRDAPIWNFANNPTTHCCIEIICRYWHWCLCSKFILSCILSHVWCSFLQH